MRNEDFWYALLCNAFIVGDATSVALVGLKSQPPLWRLDFSPTQHVSVDEHEENT